MSCCVFIAADTPLPEVTPSQNDPLHIDLDTGTIFDGGADDNDCLLPFDEVDLYSEKKYGVYLELPQFTNGRAEQITAYIRTALRKAIQFVEKQKTMIASVTLRKHTAMNLKFDKIWRGNDGKQLENVDTT